MTKQDLIDKVTLLLEHDNIDEKKVVTAILKFKRLDCYKLLPDETKLKCGWTDKQLISHACNIFNLNEDIFYTKKSGRDYVNLKKALSRVLKNQKNTLEYIADLFGGLDHSTISYYLKKVQHAEATRDSTITEIIDRLNKDIKEAETTI